MPIPSMTIHRHESTHGGPMASGGHGQAGVDDIEHLSFRRSSPAGQTGTSQLIGDWLQRRGGLGVRGQGGRIGLMPQLGPTI